MTDTCVIVRNTGAHVTDPETGVVEPESVEVYNGKCKLQSTPQAGTDREAGEYRYVVESPNLHLPIEAEVSVNDEARIVATETGNVSLNQAFRLVGLNRGTHRTSQRWNVEVPTG